MEGPEFEGRERAPIPGIVWMLCVALLLGPALLVWIVRGVGYAVHCAPGPELCHGMMLGGGLHDALMLAWVVATNVVPMLLLSLVAAIACFAARRPLLGTLSVLLLPLLTPVLPMLAVFVTRYDGCEINPDGIGTCVLWGARMGRSFHTAATIPDMIYGYVPYSFALALVVSLIGWFLVRPKAPAPMHATARIRRYDDEQ
ncbi:MAG: hypothetical protein JO261_10100 [Alphaproteobacteria bacterium]|nr:hypothetical protein [Alphaproteobacteria bacterium]MBV9694040.1 hypothetical protein [Alphaproteobacteria bacterium]